MPRGIAPNQCLADLGSGEELSGAGMAKEGLANRGRIMGSDGEQHARADNGGETGGPSGKTGLLSANICFGPPQLYAAKVCIGSYKLSESPS